MKEKYIIQDCKTHGTTTFVFELVRNCYRCRDCRTDNVTNFRRKRKLQCIEYLGGKCIDCGYNKCQASLDFHHTDPSIKETELSKLFNRKWEIVQKELDKCILICRNCHGERHEKEFLDGLQKRLERSPKGMEAVC